MKVIKGLLGLVVLAIPFAMVGYVAHEVYLWVHDPQVVAGVLDRAEAAVGARETSVRAVIVLFVACIAGALVSYLDRLIRGPRGG